MKELFERHRDHLTPEEDQAIWGHVEQKLSVERSFWKSWRFPVSIAATASAALIAFTVLRGPGDVRTGDNLTVRTLDEDRLPVQSGEVSSSTDGRQQTGSEKAQAKEVVPPQPSLKVKVSDVRNPSSAAMPEKGTASETKPANGSAEGVPTAPPSETRSEAFANQGARAGAVASAPAPAPRSALNVASTNGGTIRGQVTDEHGKPLPFANVVIVRTTLGAMSDSTGWFVLRDVPVGRYTLRASYMGYKGKEVLITVGDGQQVAENFSLSESQVKELDKVTVRSDRTKIDRSSSATRLSITSEDLQALQDEVALQSPGVTNSNQAPRDRKRDSGNYLVPPSPAVPLFQPDRSGASNSVGGTTPVNGQAFDAMFFEHYGVNPFIDPEDDKYATFAVDVDNASYTLTRSYLERGALPPKEAVRVEEFVNAMRHDYAPPQKADLSAGRDWAPSEHGTFAIHLEAAPSPFGPGLVLFRVGLKGKEIAVSERKPANLTFVVDVSGSMQREDRLELVKRSLFYLLDQMNNRDRVALVVYGTNARVILPSTSLRDRKNIEDAIARLVPEGSTNAEAGIREGYAVANESFNSRANNRIILCTDGVANVGLTDADGILDTIGRSARRGIALTAIGVGMGNYNDVLIEKLADKGDGNYYYVDDLPEAKRVFVENLTGTLQTIAKDTKIQVEFVSDAVRRYRLLGYENRDVADQDFRNNAVDAGEVGAGHEVTALFEMKLDRQATRGPVATVGIRYQDPETGRVTEEARTLRAEDILSRIQNADPTFKMDAAVAEFAEILRHSYWAKDGNLESVRDLAQNASRSMDSPRDAKEVVSLMGTAEQLWPRSQPERWNDDVRPQWEPGPNDDNR